MLKALFRKQMLEVFSWIYKDKKSGKIRGIKGIVGYTFCYLLLFGFLGVIFGMAANAMCEPLLLNEMGWLYWCLMGMIAIFLGVFGSVFNTYSSLYQAKDNDLLLSMPIPVSRILLARLSGVYAMGLLYESIVMIPTMIIWFLNAPFQIGGTVNILLIPLVLSVLILVLSAILGWVVAMVVTKVRYKNMITVGLSLTFIVGYYYVYGKVYSMLQNILVNAQQIGQKIQRILYPFYHMGLAAEGNMLSMGIFAALIIAVFVIIYWILSKNFLKLATSDQGTEKVVYKEKTAKAASVQSALLRKELRRFTGSANYMLNCGLGILLMPASAVVLVWKSDLIRMVFEMFPEEILALGMIGAVCLMISMNDLTAPSISLEGKNLWILQSFPVSGREVLMAKLKMHLLLTLIPAIVPILAIEWLLHPDLFYLIMLPIMVVLYTVLMALLGLFLNLKMPNLHWSNEIIPIKQSAPTMLTLFGGWVLVIAMAGIYYLLQKYVTAMTFSVCVAVLLAVADKSLFRWMMGKGARIFEQLQ